MKYLVIPVGDQEYISPTNVCDVCRCESDQEFVCESRCEVIAVASNCTEVERVQGADRSCPCFVCADQQGR